MSLIDAALSRSRTVVSVLVLLLITGSLTYISVPKEADPDINMVCLTLIPVTLPGRGKRINISLDENLIAEIDSITENCSGFLAEAAQAALVRRRRNA